MNEVIFREVKTIIGISKMDKKRIKKGSFICTLVLPHIKKKTKHILKKPEFLSKKLPLKCFMNFQTLFSTPKYIVNVKIILIHM